MFQTAAVWRVQHHTGPTHHFNFWHSGALALSPDHDGDDRPETNYKIMSGYDCLNKCNFSFRRNSGKDCAMSSGRLFQSLGPAEANERSPTVKWLVYSKKPVRIKKKQDCLSVDGRPPANKKHRHVLLLWPWPWPDDLDIRIEIDILNMCLPAKN